MAFIIKHRVTGEEALAIENNNQLNIPAHLYPYVRSQVLNDGKLIFYSKDKWEPMVDKKSIDRLLRRDIVSGKYKERVV